MSAVLTEQNVYAGQFSAMLDRLPGSRLPWVERLRKSGNGRLSVARFSDNEA
jgi:hypothetical protein